MKIVILGGNGVSTHIVVHEMRRHFVVDGIIIEEKTDRGAFLKRRIKKLGLLTVIGQILFLLLIVPILRMSARKRTDEILRENQFNISNDYLNDSVCLRVDSINDDVTKSRLSKIQPDIVVVNGTRIISPEILGCCDAVFINMHAGITPSYRGIHGAYWALVNSDPEHCGVTIHLVDQGIDTGEVLYQKAISITPSDNFTTYPLLQIKEGLLLEVKAVKDAIDGDLRPYKSEAVSKLYSHPTAWEYIKHRLCFHVK